MFLPTDDMIRLNFISCHMKGLIFNEMVASLSQKLGYNDVVTCVIVRRDLPGWPGLSGNVCQDDVSYDVSYVMARARPCSQLTTQDENSAEELREICFVSHAT
jgi:hypothetical protein